MGLEQTQHKVTRQLARVTCVNTATIFFSVARFMYTFTFVSVSNYNMCFESDLGQSTTRKCFHHSFYDTEANSFRPALMAPPHPYPLLLSPLSSAISQPNGKIGSRVALVNSRDISNGLVLYGDQNHTKEGKAPKPATPGKTNCHPLPCPTDDAQHHILFTFGTRKVANMVES